MAPIARIDIEFPFYETRLDQLAATPPRGMVVTSNIHDAVFISYSHRDGEAFRQACDEYQRFGIRVYTNERLEAGADFDRELSKMIASANIFHLLWSRSSAASGECRKEWVAALQREPSERFINCESVSQFHRVGHRVTTVGSRQEWRDRAELAVAFT